MGGAEGGVWGGVGLVVIWQYSIQYLGVTGTLGLWDAKDYYWVPCGAIGYHVAAWETMRHHGVPTARLQGSCHALCLRYARVMLAL